MKKKLDFEQAKRIFKKNKRYYKIGTLQVVAFVAAGGGLIGKMYAEQTADAYIDARCGRAPYGKRDLENIRKTLVAMAEAHGLDPHNLPLIPDFHSCFVF